MISNLVGYLEKQLQRAISLNPSLADDLNTSPSKADAPAANDPPEDPQANQLANLIQNSTLLKSYE